MTVGDRASSRNAAQPKGFGIVPEVGYEWWVASEWGIGGMFQLMVVRVKDTTKRETETDTVVTPSLFFTATYN